MAHKSFPLKIDKKIYFFYLHINKLIIRVISTKQIILAIYMVVNDIDLFVNYGKTYF